jgi:hypothetical protein
MGGDGSAASTYTQKANAANKVCDLLKISLILNNRRSLKQSSEPPGYTNLAISLAISMIIMVR